MKKQNKVAFAHIQALIASLEFKFERVGKTTVTGCWAFLPNGFQVGYGESACVDPNEYKQEDGEKYAKERCVANATNKLWEIEGYLLKVTGATSDNLLKWRKPEEIPNVNNGESEEFWIATERKDRSGELIRKVICAQYTNMPVSFNDNGEPDTDYHAVSEEGEAISAVGWYSVKNHYDFDDCYEAIPFDDDYKLLGWAEHLIPEFK